MTRPCYQFRARDKTLALGAKTRLMGVVNITPDSFSDGGRYIEPAQAVAHCLSLAEQGADILDLGGESSRPGSQPVSPQEEADRILPVLEEVRAETSKMISVDTYKFPVAEAALKAGADIINDISAFNLDESLAALVSENKAGVVLMHMRGQPSSMHLLPPSRDIFQEVSNDLQLAVNKAYKHNISHDRILVDPGIGFGKNAKESLQLINRLSGLQALRLPILVGTSRKSFIGKILEQPVEKRIMGTVASSIVALLRGAHVLRVHDVGELAAASSMVDAILTEDLPG